MSIDMSQFYQAFYEEAEELLTEAEHLLLKINLSTPDSEDMNAIFRAFHSIKGGSSTFGFNEMTEITHILENLLDQIRKNERPINQELVDLFLESKDVIQSQLEAYRSGLETNHVREDEIRKKLHQLSICDPTQIQSNDINPSVINMSSHEDSALSHLKSKYYNIRLATLKKKDLDNISDELALLGSIENIELNNDQYEFLLKTTDSAESIIAICSFIVEPEDIEIVEILDREAHVATITVPTKLPDIQVTPHTEKKITPIESSNPKPQAKPGTTHDEAALTGGQATSIRVGIDKVDQLINLIGELVITQAMIVQRVNKLDEIENESLFNNINQLTRNTHDLQEAVMSIRMMPMDYVFSRFPRMVYELAGKLNKKIELITVGTSTELDKGLIERIIDPLTHLVRNSIDHGIEIPSIRAALGKSETGRLSLSASNRGGNIVIEVSDDGAGLNRERILNKARQNGLPVSNTMTDSEVWQLIFAPGFSTAEIVTDVSGRGVGMDVVKRNVNALGGSIDIFSEIGRGTTMSISMPLTLAIMDGLSVSLRDSIYIVPLNMIVETLQPLAADLKTVTGQGLMIHLRNEYIPVIALHSIFQHDTHVTQPTAGILVILEAEGKKIALLVDELIGQQQVVIKSLEKNFKKIQGISGATIMGDGAVALILDVPAFIKMGQNLPAKKIVQ